MPFPSLVEISVVYYICITRGGISQSCCEPFTHTHTHTLRLPHDNATQAIVEPTSLRLAERESQNFE